MSYHHRTHDMAYPHAGACEGCREDRICNVCGTALNSFCCTNGRCPGCHRKHCTAGGATSPGHGFGHVPVLEESNAQS